MLNNLILIKCIDFSNLFGPINSGDFIPDYKLKQGETFDNVKIENL